MKGFECEHKDRELARVIMRDGRSQVLERCKECGANVRGSGKWVPRSEVPVNLETLPVAKDNRSAVDRGEQPTLFE